MAPFCGWIATDAAGANAQASMTMQTAPTTVGSALNGGHFALAGAEIAQENGITTTVAGAVRFPASELANCAAERGAAQALLQAYRSDAGDCFQQLQGNFCAVIVDAREAPVRVLGAIDRIGQQSLYYAHTGNGIVFGQSADQVGRHPDIDTAIATQGVYNYVFFHMVPSPGTIYSNISKLPAGHRFDYRLGVGDCTVAAYWRPPFSEAVAGSRETLTEELHRLLRSAVTRCSDGSSSLGAFLSGGLDSSTVSGLLAESAKEQTQTPSR